MPDSLNWNECPIVCALVCNWCNIYKSIVNNTLQTIAQKYCTKELFVFLAPCFALYFKSVSAIILAYLLSILHSIVLHCRRLETAGPSRSLSDSVTGRRRAAAAGAGLPAAAQ